VIISHVDTSKNNIKAEEQQALLADYVSEKSTKADVTLQGASIVSVLERIYSSNHTLLVANVLTLGDSLKEITENLIKLKEREMTIVSVKGNLTLTPTEPTSFNQKEKTYNLSKTTLKKERNLDDKKSIDYGNYRNGRFSFVRFFIGKYGLGHFWCLPLAESIG
jgi:hypothetical protein